MTAADSPPSNDGHPDDVRADVPEQEPVDRDLGRRRLRAALNSRPTRGQLVAAVLCALLGFAVAVQVRANQDAGLSGLRQTDLVRILDDVTERSARLQAEARELEGTRDKVSGSGTRAALDEAHQRSRTLGILAGTLPATGPGIEFTISDPAGKVTSDVLLDALQELRDAGGEAYEIGQIDGAAVRVVASTYLSDASGSDPRAGIAVDGRVLTSPYRFRVIGEPRTLAAALDIPGGVLDVLRQREAQGIVTQRSELTISSLRPVPEPEYARPAPQKSSS
ncbi:MAG: hypothetical protein QOH75_3787 [Actinomycetota bacterium]|jgi:uncharacterized protein YlxW (UPF0749 family)|nr:hypothetical protein [Actinomycetota bacterium]MDQ1669697.1 hypothetical protein [Actinomycetota bacterium]